MNINNKSFNNKLMKALQIFSIILFFYYIFNNLKTNIYEVLFIDERMLIDDIYNLWLLEDLYDRFSNISNPLLKNLLIVFIEIAYGGDLRYGRLWSNVFTLLIGPFTLINDTVVIILARVLNASLFFIGSYVLSKNIANKEYTWLVVFSIYSLPAVEYFHRIPKPDTLLIIFVALGLNATVNNKFYRAIFFLALATFIKINTIIIFFFLWIYMLQRINSSKSLFVLRTTGITLTSLIIVNPILIIPPVRIGNIDLPNFYKIYFNWLSTQSSNGDVLIFSINNFYKWIETFSSFYKFSNENYFLLFALILLIPIYFKVIKSNDSIAKYLLLIISFYFLFYFGFIERQYTHYLHLPLSLLIISFMRVVAIKNYKNIAFGILVVIGLVGSFTNIDRFNKDVEFNPNFRYGYDSINNVSDAEKLVTKVVNELSTIYSSNNHLNKNLVYWHPDLYMPRNNITYIDSFFVREYWGNKDAVDFAINDADIFVTYTDYEISENVVKSNIENYFIYYLKNLD